MNKEHNCDHHCWYGYEDENDQRRCLIAVKKKWDEMAPAIYESYRKWLDEEDGFDDEVEVTIKLPSYVARCLDLKRMEKLYFEMYTAPYNDKDSQAMQGCLTREAFVEFLLYRHSMGDDGNEESRECMTEEKIEASARECRQVLDFHNRINKGAIDYQDSLFLECDNAKATREKKSRKTKSS